MPVLSTLRTLLRDLNVNIRRRGPKLTPYKQRYIARAYITNISPREIKLVMQHLQSTIRGIIMLEILRLNRNSLLYKGRPIIYNKQDC
jgi:hypothetical protein